MTKWIKILLPAFLISCSLYSQNNIDSLKKLLETTTNTQRLFQSNLQLAEITLLSSPEKSLGYSEKALSIAQKTRDTTNLIEALTSKANYYWHEVKYRKLEILQDSIFNLANKTENIKGVAHYHRLEGLKLTDKDSIDKAIKELTKAKKIYLKTGDLKSHANTLLRIGIGYWRKANYDSTIHYYDKAEKIYKNINYTPGKAKILWFKGIVFNRTGRYAKALEAYYKAEKLFVEHGMHNKVAEVRGNIGSLHINLGNYDRAIDAYEESKRVAIENNNRKLEGIRTHDIGYTYYLMEKYNKADSCFLEALQIYKDIDFTIGQAEIIRDMGKLYHSKGNYTASTQNLTAAIKTFKEKNYIRGLAEVYYFMAKNEYARKKHTSALKSLKKAKAYNNQIKDAQLSLDIYEFLSKIQRKKGNLKEAYQAHLIFHRLYDSLTNLKSKENIARIQKNYETQKREQEIENLIKEKKIENQKFQRNLLLITFILLLIVVILIYRGYRNKKLHLQKLQKANWEMKKAKEKAEKADNLKSAFLANISHEIRTPMNAIVGFSDLIEDSDLSKQQREDLLEQIKINSNVLLNLIDDLIDFSKIESDEISMKYEHIYLNEVMDDIYLTFKSKYFHQKNNMEFEVEKPQPDVFQIVTDKNRLKQILYNLIDNAFKFTEKGYVRFGYYFEEEKPDYIHFFVKDTGVGIPKGRQKDIFKRFSKFKQSKTKYYSGTGLGLAITKALVNKMGGSIKLISAKNKGAAFYFYLPLEQNTTIES